MDMSQAPQEKYRKDYKAPSHKITDIDTFEKLLGITFSKQGMLSDIHKNHIHDLIKINGMMNEQLLINALQI